MSVYLTRTLLLSLGISIFLTICFHVLRKDLKLSPLIQFNDPKETYSATYTIRAKGYPADTGLLQQFKNAMKENINATTERIGKASFNGKVKQKNDSTYTISVQNITDTNSIRDLVIGNGRLSFNEVYTLDDVMPGFLDLIEEWPRFAGEKIEDPGTAFFGKVFLLTTNVTSAEGIPYHQPYVASVDIQKAAPVLKMLSDSVFSRKFPADVQFMFGGMDHFVQLPAKYQFLYALKKNNDPISKRNIAEVHAETDDEDRPFIAMQFDAAGARRWEKMTAKNVGRSIAICINDKVIIAPQVIQAISGGNSRISMSSLESCRVISVLLTSSDLKLPVRIIQSQVKKEAKLSPNVLTGYINYILVFIFSFAISFCVIWFVFKPGKKLSRNA